MREKFFSILFFLALFFPGCGSPLTTASCGLSR
jgi:hypothetical protein